MKTVLLAAALLAAAGAGKAHAALQIAADINGASFFCTDGLGCDSSPVSNVIITNNTTLDGILFSSSSTSSGSGALDFLNASNLLITNTNPTAVDVTITVSNTDFTGPVNAFTDASSGVWQGSKVGTATFKWWIDPTNAQGADNAFDTPGALVDTDTSNSLSLPVLSFAHNNPLISDHVVGPFSMTEQVTLHLGAGESIVNRGQTIVGSAVPETSTWVMMGLGFAVLGLAGMRRRDRFAF
jgi:hypothetical protein